MLISSAWLYLVVAGRGLLEDVPARLAWMLPLGSSPWEQTTKSMAPHGASLSEVINKLGQPDQVSEPIISATMIGGGVQHLTYINPHDPTRHVVVTIGPDGRVINAASGTRQSGD